MRPKHRLNHNLKIWAKVLLGDMERGWHSVPEAQTTPDEPDSHWG